jgi:hypothetical protein
MGGGWLLKPWLLKSGATLVCLGLAAILAVVVVQHFSPQAPPPAEQVARESRDWLQQTKSQPWRKESLAQRLKRHPIDREIAAPARRWQAIATPYADDATAYDLADPGKQPAVLFVVATNRRFEAPLAPPRDPQSTTMGEAIGVWKRDQRLYVLAVEGGAGRYRSFLRHQGEMALAESTTPATGRLRAVFLTVID